MTYVKDSHELNKIIYQLLITQSGLDKENVINGLTLYGADLTKYIEDLDIYGSYDLEDSIIVFELSADPKEGDCTMEEDDGSISSVASYSLRIVIYGESSDIMAHKLKGRLESEKVRNDMNDEGLTLGDCENPATLHDYINDALWLRSDLSMPLKAVYALTQADSYDDFDAANLKQIIKAD